MKEDREFRLSEETLEEIGKLPTKHRAEALLRVGMLESERIADDPLYWFDASRHIKTSEWPEGLPYVYTVDPHILYECRLCGLEMFADKKTPHLEQNHGMESPISFRTIRENFKELNPVRPFALMEYMPPIIEVWQRSQFLAIEKSRDMMATWLMVAMSSWDVLFHRGRQHLFQSQDANKTYELVSRANCIYQNHPAFLRRAIGPVVFSKAGTKSGEFFVLDKKSEILGFPQGPDQVRQFHPSLIFQDEAAFQSEAGAAFAAIKPAIQMGGKFVMISSANRSWFEKICRDQEE